MARKVRTLDQIQTAKDRAVRFLRDVKDDTERAAEVEAESPEDYAERRGIDIAEENPAGRVSPVRLYWLRNPKIYDRPLGGQMAKKIADVMRENKELRERNEQLEDELDQIAAIAEAPDDGKETKNELADKLNQILELVSGEQDDDGEELDDEDQDDSNGDDEYDDSEE